MTNASLEGKLTYRNIDPANPRDRSLMNILERAAFELGGNDPTEAEAAIKIMAEQGSVLVARVPLGYEEFDEHLEDHIESTGILLWKKHMLPVAFIELISYGKALDFFSKTYSSASGVQRDSLRGPLMISMESHQRIYAPTVEKYCGGDLSKLIIDNGIGVHVEYHKRRVGTQLLDHAMKSPIVQGKVVQCHIDIFRRAEAGEEDIFNDRSFALHLKKGFVVSGVLEPPVYDDKIVYATTLYIPGLKVKAEDRRQLDIGELRKRPASMAIVIGHLTGDGYLGIGYNSRTQIMEFAKPQ